jgi:hypothetical protein
MAYVNCPPSSAVPEQVQAVPVSVRVRLPYSKARTAATSGPSSSSSSSSSPPTGCSFDPLTSEPSPPDCALPFAFFLLFFFFFLAAKGMPGQPSPMPEMNVEGWRHWVFVLPDLLIESEALAADMFSILLYNEHVCVRIDMSLHLIWHLEYVESMPEADTLESRGTRQRD